MVAWPLYEEVKESNAKLARLGKFLMKQKTWRAAFQETWDFHTDSRVGRAERAVASQWRFRIFVKSESDGKSILEVRC